MAKQVELPEEAAALQTLEKVLEARRLTHLEKMATGLSYEEYREHVGRAKEDKWLIEQVATRLKHLLGDDE